MTLRPDDIDPGMLVTVLKSQCLTTEASIFLGGQSEAKMQEDARWYGSVFRVLAVNLPYVATIGISKNVRKGRFVFDLRNTMLHRVTPEYARALMDPKARKEAKKRLDSKVQSLDYFIGFTTDDDT